MPTNRTTKKAPAKAGADTGPVSDPLLEKFERDHAGVLACEALSIDQQWEEIQGWYDYLVLHAESDWPAVNSLNEQWNEIREATGMTDAEYGRGKELRRTSDSPLTALMYFIDMGFYPPPELLLGLQDAWDRYVGAQGKLTLEDAFFGPSKKGVGNYSARKASRFRLMWLRWEFDRMLREGMNRTAIAEELSNRLGGKPDADSILRMMRGFTGLFAKHSDTPPEK